jgi:hypothetical protein
MALAREEGIQMRAELRIVLIILLMIFISFPLNQLPRNVQAAVTCSNSQSSSWQICGPIEALTGIDEQPTGIQANDGTLRLAWTHIIGSGASSIYYNTRLTNGTWLNAAPITNLGGLNQNPSLVQANNGTIFLFWSYRPATGPDSSHYRINYRYLKGTVWSSYVNATATPATMNDTMPSAAVGSDGTLWLIWTRDNSTSLGTTPVMRQLWYKTLSSNVWSQEGSITDRLDTNWNWQPSIIVPKDGTPRIAFSRGRPSLANFQINYITRAGTGWSPPVPIVNSNSTARDQNPSMLQDRNGTLWVFWSRDMNTNFVVRVESSVDNGAHWTVDIALTAACVGCADSQGPSAVQSNTSTDKNIWVFYSTNPSQFGTGFDIWAFKTTNPIYPVHDVSVPLAFYSLSNIVQYAGGFPGSYVGQSPIESIYATVQNLGDLPENVTLRLTVSNTTIYSFTQILLIPSGTSGSFAFNWNTTGVKPAVYRMLANATIPVETFGNRADNVVRVANAIHLYPLGDVNQDGAINIVDISIANLGYGATPGNPRWNPFANITGSGVISIVDINYISYRYGTFT